MNAAAAGLRADRTPHFPEINLAAAGPHAHKILRLTHRNVAAGSFQIRPSGNSSRANVSPAAVQGSVRGDVACVDVPPGGKGGQVPGNIKDLDVPALGFQPRNRTPAGNLPHPYSSYSSRGNASALRLQQRGAADISGGDIARACIDFHVVIARDGDLELHPELRIRVVRGLRKQNARDFHARRRGSSLQGIVIQQLRRN